MTGISFSGARHDADSAGPRDYRGRAGWPDLGLRRLDLACPERNGLPDHAARPVARADGNGDGGLRAETVQRLRWIRFFSMISGKFRPPSRMRQPTRRNPALADRAVLPGPQGPGRHGPVRAPALVRVASAHALRVLARHYLIVDKRSAAEKQRGMGAGGAGEKERVRRYDSSAVRQYRNRESRCRAAWCLGGESPWRPWRPAFRWRLGGKSGSGYRSRAMRPVRMDSTIL